MSLSTTKSIGRQPKKWTTDEDQKLREQVEAQSAYKCPFPYCQHLECEEAARPKPLLTHTPFVTQDRYADQLAQCREAKSKTGMLLQFPPQLSYSWLILCRCRIAAKLPGRTNKDCRKRWHNSVAGGLKKGQWSKSEDVQLARGVQQYGQRYALDSSVRGLDCSYDDLGGPW